MKEQILAKVIAIEKELPAYSEAIGLHTGEAGKAIFYSYLSSYLNTNEYDDKIEKSLLTIFEEINTGDFNTTFCSGLAGIVWGIEHLKEKKLLELEDGFESIHNALKESALNNSRTGNFDFLHGADGIVYSLLRMNATDESFINNWLELLHECAHKENDNYVWETVMDIESGNKGLNLSLSHGLSSKIIVLAETVKKYPENKLARQLLEGSVNYLLQAKNTESVGCCFPSHIDKDNTGKHSRLAWCYGDMGNAIALWRAGSLMNSELWKNQAIHTMLYAAKRKDLIREHVADAGFCHGSAGIAHIFNRFYMETGRIEFDEARWYWIEKTLDMGKGPGGIAGFKKYSGVEKQYVTEPGFLEGATGIALVLLGFLTDKKEHIAWDACFLMN